MWTASSYGTEEKRGEELSASIHLCFLAVGITAASHSHHHAFPTMMNCAVSQSQLPGGSYYQGRISTDLAQAQLED